MNFLQDIVYHFFLLYRLYCLVSGYLSIKCLRLGADFWKILCDKREVLVSRR